MLNPSECRDLPEAEEPNSLREFTQGVGALIAAMKSSSHDAGEGKGGDIPNLDNLGVKGGDTPTADPEKQGDLPLSEIMRNEVLKSW